MLDHKEDYVRVTDIKEYTYCPRVYYYEACLPGLHHSTVKMQVGRQAHERERELARRRTLAAYGLAEGERVFDLRVVSQRWKVVGEIDEVLFCPEEAIPVDYKNTTRLGYNFRLQLAAYGVLLAETTGMPVQRGFFFLIPARKAEELVFTTKLWRAAERALAAMRHIVTTEQVPSPTSYRDRCLTCKYRRFCNDV
jgi:CRISPR-associated exonuclease Cas4